jgi:hypothetical protein
MNDVGTRLGLPIRAFGNEAALDRWLELEPKPSSGFWMTIGKKGTEGAGISNKAVELCSSTVRAGALDAFAERGTHPSI